MPLYEYQDEAGTVVEAFRHTAERDRPPRPGFRRIVSVPAPPDLRRKYEEKTSTAASLRKGLRRAEFSRPAGMRDHLSNPSTMRLLRQEAGLT